ncbi:type IIL restriction-modification enzyme MmeI [Cupriavidus basilensis]
MEAKNISPYLMDFDDVIVKKRSKPLAVLPPMDFGNMANDGGGLLLLPEEKGATVEHIA